MQKGVLRRPGGQTPETLASGPGPDAEAHGVWARRQGLWRLVLESEWDSCLSGKTDFEEAFAPSFDPGAQHINRGAGLAPKTQEVDPRDLFLSRVRCPLPPYSSIIL